MEENDTALRMTAINLVGDLARSEALEKMTPAEVMTMVTMVYEFLDAAKDGKENLKLEFVQ